MNTSYLVKEYYHVGSQRTVEKFAKDELGASGNKAYVPVKLVHDLQAHNLGINVL